MKQCGAGDVTSHNQPGLEPIAVADSLSPYVTNPLVGHGSIDHRVRDRAMTHESLKRPCIDSTSRQGIAGSMPQHVSMDRKWQLSGLAKPFYKLLGVVDRKRRFPLG